MDTWLEELNPESLQVCVVGAGVLGFWAFKGEIDVSVYAIGTAVCVPRAYGVC